MVELSKRFKLSIGEEPELKHSAREVRVDGTGSELDKRRQGQGHLAQLAGELGILGEAATKRCLVVAVVGRQATMVHHGCGGNVFL